MAGEMFQWELCKSLKFGHFDKYVSKPEFVLENEAHKTLLGIGDHTEW